MAKVKLNCSKEIYTILEKHLLERSIPITSSSDDTSVLIQEITSEINLKDLKPSSNYDFIFIISKETPIFDLLDYKPLGFIRSEYLHQDIERLSQWIHSKQPLLEFHASGNSLLISPEQIIYIESYLHYLYIHTVNSSFKIRKNLSGILEELKPYHFIQIHRSYIVNEKYVEAIESECILKNGTMLPIGSKYKKLMIFS